MQRFFRCAHVWLSICALLPLMSFSPLRAAEPRAAHSPAAADHAAAATPHAAQKVGEGHADSAHAAAPAAPAHNTAGAAMTAEKALELLQDGNARFLAGKSTHPHTDAARLKETAEEGQHPIVTIVSCSDSRVPVEFLLDQGFGDVFVIRVAGNVCDQDEIGTAEYGTEHLGTPLLVVMGHSNCGAVTAVATGAPVHGHIPALVDNIKPAVARAQKEHPDLHGKDLVPAAIEANVWQSMEDLLRQSEIVRELVESGKLRMVGAVCDIASGKINWLGAHPQQARLMSEAKTMAASQPANAHDSHSAGGGGPMAADAAIKMLQDGNARFVMGKSIHPHADAARLKETAESGQQPFATIVSCADSRVPVEFLLDQGFGDLFVVRVAGNVCDEDEIGTVEYGTEHLGTPVLMVLGHTRCGAVTAVATGAEVHGHIPALVDNIKPAVAKAQQEHPELQGKELVPAAIEANVWQSIEDLLRHSEIVRERVETGKLQAVGGICDIADGKIRWLGVHPLQKRLLIEAQANSPTHAEASATTAPADDHAEASTNDHARSTAKEASTVAGAGHEHR